jgi:hypothetical protein
LTNPRLWPVASEPILRRLRAIGGLTSRLDIPNQTVVLALQPLLTSVARIIVQLGGSAAGTRRALNFIAGTNVTISAADDAANERINITIDSSGGGGGGIAGPGSSTDNAVTRWDGTAGAAVQNSLVTISDTGSISLPALQTVDGRDVSVDGGGGPPHVAPRRRDALADVVAHDPPFSPGSAPGPRAPPVELSAIFGRRRPPTGPRRPRSERVRR